MSHARMIAVGATAVLLSLPLVATAAQETPSEPPPAATAECPHQDLDPGEHGRLHGQMQAMGDGQHQEMHAEMAGMMGTMMSQSAAGGRASRPSNSPMMGF